MNTQRTFDLPLCTSSAVHCGNLRITYNDKGFMYADYYMNRSSLGDRLPGPLLQSTLFKPVMEEIAGAIKAHTEDIDTDNHSHLIIELS